MLAGWLWFLGTLIPVIGLVQVGMQAWADRFLYLPVIGLLMMGVWVATDGMDRWKIKPLWRLTLMAALMATLITLTIRQSATWKNSGTVGRQALESSGKNFIAETLIGNYLEARGEIEPAIEQYRRAIQARPDYFVSHSRLGALLDRQGKTDEAIKSYVRALELNPELYGVQLMLGRALMQQGKNDVALELFQNVIVHNPGDAVAHYAAGSACEAGKDFDRALSYYSRAAQLNPVYETIRLRLIERMRQEKMKPGY
jgi:tetratricopeptide (TPR) repeat protein